MKQTPRCKVIRHGFTDERELIEIARHRLSRLTVHLQPRMIRGASLVVIGRTFGWSAYLMWIRSFARRSS